jgi:hypothetical protein
MDEVERARSGVWTDNSLTLGIPRGWSFKESYTLIAPDGQANVIASTEPLPHSMTPFEYQQRQGNELQAEFPEYREHSLEQITVLGLDQLAFLRTFSWRPEEAEQVTQMQLYAVESGRGITVTATTPSVHFAEQRPTLIEAIRSIKVHVEVLRTFSLDQQQ